VTTVVTFIPSSRVEVVGGPKAFKPSSLRFDGLRDQLMRTPLLAREEVADLHHLLLSRDAAVLPATTGCNQWHLRE